MKYCLVLTWLPLNYQTFSYIVLNTCSTGTMVDDGSVSTYTYKQTVPEAGCTGRLLLNNLGYLVSIPTSPLSNCSSLCDLFILHNIFVNKLTSQYRSIIFNGTTIKNRLRLLSQSYYNATTKKAICQLQIPYSSTLVIRTSLINLSSNAFQFNFTSTSLYR